jgi:tetratricopeptide (TPR) repeat protein
VTRTRFFWALLLLVSTLAPAGDTRIDPIQSAMEATEWKEALDLAEQWVDEEPESSVAHYWLALALRTKMETVSKIRAIASVDNYTEALERAIVLDPKNIDALQEHIGYLIHAPGIAGGDRDQAREEIGALEKVDPVAALEMRIELFRKEEDTTGQIATLKQLRLLEPENAAYDLEAALLLIETEDYEEAERLLLDTQASDEPGVALAGRYYRARWRVIAERDLGTARDLLIAYIEARGDGPLSYAPSKAAAYWRLGLAYDGLGERSAAIEALETSIELDPDFKPAAKDLKRLRRGH